MSGASRMIAAIRAAHQLSTPQFAVAPAPRDGPSIAAPGRIAHVKRIFAVDSSNTVDPDVWIDVLRIDELPIAFQSKSDTGTVGQIIQHVLLWNDDPNNPLPYVDNSNADIQGENANATRNTHPLQIYDPADPPTDPGPLDDNPWLWVVDRLPVQFQSDSESGAVGQTIWLVFDNTQPDGNIGLGPNKPPSQRVVGVAKVVNNDLGGAQMSDDDGSNPALVDWETYFEAYQAGTIDDTQSINVEFTERYTIQFQSDTDTGMVGQDIWFQFATTRLIEPFFQAGDPDVVDVNGNPAVFRTDPFQTIVNVGYGGLAVEFGNHEGPPKK